MPISNECMILLLLGLHMELEYSRYDCMYVVKSFDSYHKSGEIGRLYLS